MKKPTAARAFSATAALSAILTAGFPWQEVLAGWVLGLGAGFALKRCRRRGNSFSAAVELCLSAAILAALALTAESAFPQERTFPFVSAVMLMLLWRSLIGTEENPQVVGNILGMAVVPLLGILLVFGVKKLEWTEVVPRRFSLPGIAMGAAIASLWSGETLRGKQWLWLPGSLVAACGVSLLTYGLLGKVLAAGAEAPFYRCVQCIRVFGNLQRMEALFASAVIAGVFSGMLSTGERMRRAMLHLWPQKRLRALTGILLAMVFAVEIILRQGRDTLRSLAGTGILGGVLFLMGLILFGGNREKPLDIGGKGG